MVCENDDDVNAELAVLKCRTKYELKVMLVDLRSTAVYLPLPKPGNDA